VFATFLLNSAHSHGLLLLLKDMRLGSDCVLLENGSIQKKSSSFLSKPLRRGQRSWPFLADPARLRQSTGGEIVMI
jgi:hypothetical protein